MESVVLFSSNNEEYIVNPHKDTELYRRNGNKLEFCRTMGKLINPHRVTFSKDDSKLLIQNNNALMELFDMATFKKKKLKAPRNAGNVLFLNDDTLIFPTELGKIYTMDIATQELHLHFDYDNLTYANLFRLTDNKFIFAGYDNAKSESQIYILECNLEEITIRLIGRPTSEISTDGMAFYKDNVYFVNCDNQLLAFNCNSINTSVTDNVCFDFNTHDVPNKLNRHQDYLFQLFPILKEHLTGELMFKNVCQYNNYIIVAFSGGIAILDADNYSLLQTVPVYRGIDNILITHTDGQIWFSDGFSVYVGSFDDLLKGELKVNVDCVSHYMTY